LVLDDILTKRASCDEADSTVDLSKTLSFSSSDRSSSKVYNFIKTTLSLPTIRTPNRTTSKFEILPGLNDFLFNFINFKTRNYTPETLQCILCADEMFLKTNLYYLIKKYGIM